MKWYIWIAIAVLAYLFFFRFFFRKSVSSTLPASASKGLNSAVKGAPAAYDTNPNNYRPTTDQSAYPGWYQSSVDGSWYNPDTGDFYSAGSSPPAVVYANPELVTIDFAGMAAAVAASQAANAGVPNTTDDPGYVIY
jgi:hypothetical protein